MLIKHHPFFGHIMSNIVRIKDDSVKLFSLSITSEAKIALHYNVMDIKEYIEKKHITLENLTAMVQHTIYHLINEHFHRRNDPLYTAWIVTPIGPCRLIDIAMDVAINQYIKNLPVNAITLKTFNDALPPGENAEYYYRVLLDYAKKNKKEMFSFLGELLCGDADGFLFFDGDKRPQQEQFSRIMRFLPFDKELFVGIELGRRTKA